MSHFTEIAVNFDQKQEAALVKALEQKFGEGNVEVSDSGIPLQGIGGDDRSRLKESDPNYAPPCNIRIKRKHVGGAANDVGYRRTEDGKYVAYISEYDMGTNFNLKKQGLVAQEYALLVSEKKLKLEGWTTKRVQADDGHIKVEAYKY